MYPILYVLALIAELVFLIGFSVYMFFLIYSHFKGAPYVPTKMKEVYAILDEVKPKSNSFFLELGCGDGRVVRTAVSKYKVHGVGVDVNPLLLNWSKVLARFQMGRGAVFERQNVFTMDFSKADYVYTFLMPQMLEKMVPQFKKMKKGAVLISHGFIIEKLTKRLVKKIDHKPFPTYIYRPS